MKKYSFLPLYWGLLHGLNDWIAGYMLAYFTLHAPAEQSFMTLIVYSILAFGGQLPLGLWVDKDRNLKNFGLSSICLLVVSILIFFMNPFIAIIIAGIASAGVHVIGGSVCLMVNKEKITPLGIFAAPGVAGLALGGFSGMLSNIWLLIPLGLILLVAMLIIKSGFPAYYLKQQSNSSQLDSHDWMMLTILLIMCMRSFLFDLMNTYSMQFENGLLIIGLSAFAGKLIGGYIADKIGWKKYVYITLPLSFILLQLGHDHIIAFAFGIGCLQSSVPVTLWLMYQSIPQFPATASAFSLGTAVALAGLPLYGTSYLHDKITASNIFYATAVAVVTVFLLAAFYLYKGKIMTVPKSISNQAGVI